MSGASVLYVWEPKSWIFITILSVGMVFTILLIPLGLGLIHHYTDSTLRHFSDKINLRVLLRQFLRSELCPQILPQQTHDFFLFFHGPDFHVHLHR
jgi:hypothetical protein